jgi:hypothetical protein
LWLIALILEVRLDLTPSLQLVLAIRYNDFVRS